MEVITTYGIEKDCDRFAPIIIEEENFCDNCKLLSSSNCPLRVREIIDESNKKHSDMFKRLAE